MERFVERPPQYYFILCSDGLRPPTGFNFDAHRAPLQEQARDLAVAGVADLGPAGSCYLCGLPRSATRGYYMITANGSNKSEPARGLAFILQVGLAEFCAEISFLPQNHAVVQGQGNGNRKKDRDPVVEEKAEGDLE